MLLKLSIRNMKRSFKDYTIYFLTLVLGVGIFYVFNSLENQTIMLEVSSSTREIIKMMIDILSGVSVLVSMILGFLIIYANRFLMKRRHKEFGIYMTLGMGKRQISWILLCETFLIGLISLVIGAVVGIALSQVMSVFVAHMFEVDMTKFEFVFSSSALLKTVLYFGIIYLIVMIFNVFSIGHHELIDLLLAHRKNENLKMKNPWLCCLVFIVAVCMLAYAYYLVTAGIHKLDSADKILIPIGLGIVSTFMIFYSLSGFALKLFMSRKKLYHKDLNSFTLRQLSSQMNTTVVSMGLICLMLFVTICVLSSAISLRNASIANMEQLVPVDIILGKEWDLEDQDIEQAKISDSHIPVSETLMKLDFDTERYFQDIIEVNIYATNDLTLGDTLKSQIDEIKKQYPFMQFDTPETIMRISDYNQVASRYGNETFTLEDHQYMILANFAGTTDIRNRCLTQHEKIELLGQSYEPKYQECKDGFLWMSANYTNPGIVVVPDHAVDHSIRQENVMIADYKASSKEGKREIENQIIALENHPYTKNTILEANTKISIYDSSLGMGTMMTFIGIYLGVIFLISSAALLALKELSESADNKVRYQMLRNIGVDEKMMNKALFTQIALFFLVPLTLAIIHSIFGIQFCGAVLLSFGEEEILSSIIITAIFIVCIYGGYLYVTYLCSKQMIKE